jgi:hypothetical protein
MAHYIVVDGDNNIIGRGKIGDIEIDWPSKDDQPAKISDCFYDGSTVKLKTSEMLLNDFKLYLKDLLFSTISENIPLLKHNIADINAQYEVFIQNATSWTTQEQCINAYNTAIDWLGLNEGYHYE